MALKKKSYDDVILSHYKKVARNHGLSANSTIEDDYIRESEVKFFVTEIDRYIKKSGKKKPYIWDLGCGNGYLLSILANEFPKAKLKGTEFSPELIKLAKQRKLKNAEIIQGDCRNPSYFNEHHDIIITERVIINILNNKDQDEAMGNIAKGLTAKGRYLMSESFKESLDELNLARKEVCLSKVTPSYQNKYLSEHRIKRLLQKKMKELEPAIPSNYMSTRFYLTRVLHPVLRPKGGRLKNSQMVKFFTGALPPAVGNYSPILFRVFEKI